MNYDFYANIGYTVVWCIKHILVPFGVATASTIITYKLLQPQPVRQRKKRSVRNRFK